MQRPRGHRPAPAFAAPWLAVLWLAAGCDRRPSAPPRPPPTSSAPIAAGGPVAPATTSSVVAAGSRRPPAPGRPAPGEAAGVHYLELSTGGAAAEDRVPMVVAIHGLGDRPEDFAAVLPPLGVPARVILPRGLEPYGRGFSWFAFRRDALPADLAAGIRAAADRLAAALHELAKKRPTAGKPIVTGFSQGGMLTFALAVHHPEVVGAAYPLGGLLPAPLLPAAAAPGVAPAIVAFHGAADAVVPVAGARATVANLKERGFSAELHESAGVGHTVPLEMRQAVQALIEAAARRAAE